ncbi:hypothetical protein FHX52_0841 [Humibacillus xanthopallidus]|uniref:DUF1254 domain-containing protein n=1 Tax=Humibacillus xanthopallidus TaxID=412689 RepID=A0A543PUJ1_9MICO|nr:DUF1254 domain-containing protein [Humibacillus xanthopallidus]TQN47726.1 hypothetical protein FHX52_0841 [Humibacillus xanthopallidus]
MTSAQDLARRCVPPSLPTVDLHRILVGFALDPASPEYRAPLNHVHHSRDLADPQDRSVVNLNVDTPYSYAWLDLRGGPVLLTMPAHEPDRYMSAQLVDLYTHIVGYVSPRTGGTAGGAFLVRGPSKAGPAVDADEVFDCPTDLCLVLVRTQLFDDADLPNVARLQDEVTLEPLGFPRPAPTGWPAPVDVRAPLDAGFLEAMDWMLQFMPRLPEDTNIRADLAELGCGTGQVADLLSVLDVAAQVRTGLEQGRQDVLARCATVRSSAELFGSREMLSGDDLTRAAGAYLGILGNAAEEYLGVGYHGDSHGRPFDGQHGYTIRFAPDGLPPVDAFWSITLYDAGQHLYANELSRYSLGTRQLPGMLRDPDGGLTVHVQHDRPSPQLLANWLPAPQAPFGLTFRTYLPRDAIRDGSWTAPPVTRTP